MLDLQPGNNNKLSLILNHITKKIMMSIQSRGITWILFNNNNNNNSAVPLVVNHHRWLQKLLRLFIIMANLLSQDQLLQLHNVNKDTKTWLKSTNLKLSEIKQQRTSIPTHKIRLLTRPLLPILLWSNLKLPSNMLKLWLLESQIWALWNKNSNSETISTSSSTMTWPVLMLNSERLNLKLNMNSLQLIR